MRTGAIHVGSPDRDTTADSIDEIKHKLAELDELIAPWRGKNAEDPPA
jgi:hypothetical protein